MQRLVLDLDGTITEDDPSRLYPDKQPNLAVVAQIRHYKAQGFTIIIQSARNMRTYAGNVGQITAFTLPVIIDWLRRHEVPYDEIHIGKPWCGTDGFYVDDRAIRPDEFTRLSLDEIHRLIGRSA